jgi:hypothetical protein
MTACLAGCSAAANLEEHDSTLTAAVEEEAAALPSVRPNRALDATLNLLTRVKTDSGSVLEFYEPKPGDILISEAGSDGATPSRALSRTLSPSAAYRAVAPSLPVPAKLLAAEARLAASTPSAVEHPRPAPQSGRGSPPAWLTPSGHRGTVHADAVDPNAYCGRQWFVNNISQAYGDCMVSEQNYQWCFYDTGPGAWATGGNVWADQAELCVAAGDGVFLTVNRQGDNNAGGNWSVPAPGWRYFWHHAGSNFLGYLNRYNVQINTPGNWGDLQFAGDMFN